MNEAAKQKQRSEAEGGAGAWYELVLDAEQRELIERFAKGPEAGQISGDDETTIAEWFIERARRSSDRIAVVARGRRLTYGELAARVDALARRLVEAGVGVGDRVALWMPASIDVPVAMLGILRAGGVFLPIDAGTPVARASAILEDSGAKLLLTSACDPLPAVRTLLESGSGSAFVLELSDERPAPPSAPAAAWPAIAARDGAYLIYTSGTTGAPKGVLIEHRSLVHYVRAFLLRHGREEPHRAALLTSHAFDLGYTAIWPTLLSGGELHLLPEAMRGDALAISRYLGEHRISFLKVTPSLLSALLASSAFDGERSASLRLVVTGGEPVRARDIETLYARSPQAQVVNHYGPTETTIGVTTHWMERAQLSAFTRCPVIGRPLGDVRAYLVSPALQLLPIGEVGELLLGGPCVARGYHRREQLSKDRFVEVGGGTFYRTGDLARWTSEGTLELLGRADRQVKIRGYRVELAEIEQALLFVSEAREVAVVEQPLGGAPGEAEKILCAYYVADAALDASELAQRLAELLPSYMVPAHFVPVPELPRSANGKLEVARLPMPSATSITVSPDEPDGPDGPDGRATERAVLALWAKILGPRAADGGVSSNFFELGGHSLSMIHLIAELEDAFGVEVPVALFFEEGTVRALARYVDAQRRGRRGDR